MCDGGAKDDGRSGAWRLGVVPYLNGVPLALGFTCGPEARYARYVKEVPSRLAECLHDGKLDAAIVSSIECFRGKRTAVLPGLGIAASGQVMSIKLFATQDLARVRTVALDSSSRSAAALTRVLFAELCGAVPHFLRRPPDLDGMLSDCDAALLIGDAALRADAPPGVEEYDLGRVWYDVTGLPFVYALWGGRQESFDAGLGDLLWRSWEYGMEHLDEIAEAEAARLGLSRELCLDYLRRVITYRLGEPEEAGLWRFLELAAKHGLLEPLARERVAVAVR